MLKESKKYFQEVKGIILVIFILTLIFGYNDNNSIFVLENWLNNLVAVFAFVCITILTFILGIKISSEKMGNKAEIILTKNDKSLKSYGKILISLATTIISLGQIFFTPIYNVTIKKIKKIGSDYEHEKEFERGFSFFTGIFFNLILFLILSYFNLDLGIKIVTWFIAWNLVPFASQSGSEILFSSKPLFIFSISFIPITMILAQTLGPIFSLVLAFLLALLIFLYYYYNLEFK